MLSHFPGDDMNVLYIDYNLIGESSATGQTLNNIFQNLKETKVLQYCPDYSPQYHITTFQAVYEKKLSNPEYYIIKSIYRKLFGIKDSNENVAYMANNGNSSTFISLGKLFLDLLPHRIDRKTFRKLTDFKPDLIYILGGSITSLKLALKMSKKFDIPIVFHIMDDWYSTAYNSSVYTRFGHKMVMKLTDRGLGRSTINLAISRKMADYYSEKFGKRFDYAMNCVKSISYSKKTETDLITVLFSGGLHGGRAESLVEVGKAIKRDEYLTSKCVLKIYSSRNYLDEYGSQLSDYCSLNEYVPREQLFDNLKCADILLHVESFEEREINFFRYSMSTKIPEYLSVGRPVIVFGPKEICSVSFVDNNIVGFSCTNIKDFVNKLKLLCEDRSLREYFELRAVKVAEEEFLSENVGKKIEFLFKEAKELWLMK